MNPAGSYFDVVVFASDGSPLEWPPQHLIMVLDLDHMPAFQHRPMIVDSGYGCVRLPCADGPFTVGMPLAMTGFGHVHVYADNEGRGYDHREVAGRRLVLNVEFAKSRLAAVRRAAERWSADLASPSRTCRAARRSRSRAPGTPRDVLARPVAAGRGAARPRARAGPDRRRAEAG